MLVPVEGYTTGKVNDMAAWWKVSIICHGYHDNQSGQHTIIKRLIESSHQNVISASTAASQSLVCPESNTRRRAGKAQRVWLSGNNTGNVSPVAVALIKRVRILSKETIPIISVRYQTPRAETTSQSWMPVVDACVNNRHLHSLSGDSLGLKPIDLCHNVR